MIERLFDLAAIRQNVESVSKMVADLRADLSNLFVKIQIDSPADITGQIKQLNDSYSKLSSAITQVTKAQLEQEKLATQQAKTALQQERVTTERAKQENIRAKTASANSRYTRQTIVTEQQLNAVLGVQAKTMAEAAEQNRILRAAAKQLDLTQAENVEKLKTYNAQINENTNLIRANSDAATQQKMNIGNYNSVWKGMNTSVQQLVRELPAAKYGVDIFFLAISNNIPMLMDSIKALKEHNKAMAEMGRTENTISTFKALTKSLLSWQTAVMIGVTLLVQYGGELVKFVGSLFKTKEAVSVNAMAYRELSAARAEGFKNATEDLLKLQLLTRAYNDNTLSVRERANALEEVRELTREYLGNEAAQQLKNITTETELYKQLQAEIIKTAHARAKQAAIQKIYEDFYDFTSSRERLRGMAYTEEEINDKIDELNKSLGGHTGTNVFAKTFYPNLSGTRRRQRQDVEFLIQAKKNLEVIQQLASSIETSEIVEMYSDSSGGSSGGGSAKSYAQGTIGWWEQVINDLQELAKNTKSDKDYKEIMDKIGRAEEVIAALKGEQNLYEQFLSDVISENSIESLKVKRDREIAEIESEYKENISQIQERGGEFAEQEANAIKALQDARIRKIKDANERYEKELAAEAKRGSKAIIASLELALEANMDNLDAANALDEKNLLESELLLLNKYNKGLIDERTYQEELIKIQTEYAIEKQKTLIKFAEEEINIISGRHRRLIDKQVELINKRKAEVNPELQAQLESELAIVNATLGDEMFSNENITSLVAQIGVLEAELDKLLADVKRSTKKKTAEIAMDVFDVVNDIAAQVNDSVSAFHNARLQMIEEESNAVEESYNKQLEAIERLYEQGAISQAEYEARKRLAEKTTARQREALEKKRREEEIRQAKWDKANAIAQAAINTAVAITQNLGTWWMIPIIALLGAAQIATIAATPIPKYAKGTDSHKGGLAIVGDGGRQEVILTNGGAYITPDTPTVVDLPRGAKVLPDINQLSHKNFSLSGADFLVYNEKGEPIIINDYARLEREQKLTRKQLEKQGKFFNSVEKRRRIAEYKSRFV